MSISKGEAAPGASSATQVRDRAENFRATLGARQEADVILAEAAEVRRRAAEQAASLVAEAEALSAALAEQAQAHLELVTAEARERADSILAEARETAAEVREEARLAAEAARSDLLEQLESENRMRLHGVRDRAEGLLVDMERVVRGLGTTLHQAEGSVAEVERALSLVRSEAVDRLPATPTAPPTVLTSVPSVEHDEHVGDVQDEVDELDEVDASDRQASTEAVLVGIEPEEHESGWEPSQVPVPDPEAGRTVASGAHGVDRSVRQTDDSDQRPLGWLFRSTRP